MLAGDPSHFARFELDERLDLDPADLEARYHALARAHHPDRFARAGAQAQAEAAERMEAVNRAYRTLKDPWERVRYVLASHGADLSRAQVPAALAEEYFEIQETLEELVAGGVCDAALVRLTELATDLKGTSEEWERELSELSREHDALAAPRRAPVRERLARLVGDLSYLRALRRDLDTRLMAAGV